MQARKNGAPIAPGPGAEQVSVPSALTTDRSHGTFSTLKPQRVPLPASDSRSGWAKLLSPLRAHRLSSILRAESEPPSGSPGEFSPSRAQAASFQAAHGVRIHWSPGLRFQSRRKASLIAFRCQYCVLGARGRSPLEGAKTRLDLVSLRSLAFSRSRPYSRSKDVHETLFFNTMSQPTSKLYVGCVLVFSVRSHACAAVYEGLGVARSTMAHCLTS